MVRGIGADGNAAFLRLGENAFAVESGAVIDDLDHNAPALLRGLQDQGALGRLSCRLPDLGGFNAVIQTIADQVRQRVR